MSMQILVEDADPRVDAAVEAESDARVGGRRTKVRILPSSFERPIRATTSYSQIEQASAGRLGEIS